MANSYHGRGKISSRPWGVNDTDTLMEQYLLGAYSFYKAVFYVDGIATKNRLTIKVLIFYCQPIVMAYCQHIND